MNPDAKIIIVGAGVSGIVTAKFLLLDGFKDVTLLESYRHPGGVWAKGRAYPRLSTNSVRGNYSLSDANLYRTPEEWKAMGEKDGGYWVYGDEIREGLERYAEKWNVLPRIKFHHTVSDISEVPAPGTLKWRVDYTNDLEKTSHTVVADYLVVCTGLFSRPNLPKGIPGQLPTDKDAFKGPQYHSSEVALDENIQKVLKAKNVALVGFGKSSLDLAEWLGLERRDAKAAGKEPNNVHMVFRQPHWYVPMQFFASMDFMTRAGAAGPWWRNTWKPGDPDPDAANEADRKGGATPARSTSSKSREQMLGKKVPIEEAVRLGHKLAENHVLLPKFKFGADSSFGVASQHFFPLVHSNDINLHLVDKILGIHTDSKTGENYMLVRSKDRDGQVSAETERIPCDAVIYSTGFHFSFPFIKPALAAKMQIPEDNLGGAPRFFRTILPLCYRETATIAFNGLFNSSSCACDIEVAAHWISELFIQGGVKAGDEGRGILKVPDVKEMDRQVYLFDQLDKHFEAGGGTKEGKVHVFGRYIDFADDMLMDMGLRTIRNGTSRAEDWTKVYLATSWAGLQKERKERREALAKQRANL